MQTAGPRFLDPVSIAAEHQPKDAIGAATKAFLLTGGAGLFVSAIQNSLQRTNVGSMGIFTKTGATTTTFAACGAAYAFSRTAAANLRQKEDSWNPAIGGFFGGAMIGLRVRTAPAVLGFGAGLAIVLGAFDYTGAVLTGYSKDPAVDEVGRKEFLRRNRRRPIEEIVEQLGEGRGIYGPGYEERRRERIKERYGIDLNAAGVPSSH